MNKKANKKEEKVKKEKTRRDLGRVAIKVIAAVLAFIMVAAVAVSLLYYIAI